MSRLVYLSPVPWNSFSQRPHKFAEWFHSTTQGDVLWVDPYPTRFPNLADLRKPSTRSASPLATRSEDWLKVLPARALPIEPIPGSRLINSLLWQDLLREVNEFSAVEGTTLAIGKPSELAIQLLKQGSFANTIYDAMDDFPAFYSGISKWAMQHRESIVANKAKHLLASSTVLVDRFAHARKATLCMNACAIETLPSVDRLPVRPGERILGYVGTIGPWFDWAMINRLANCSQVKIRLIGPMFSPPAAALPPNVEVHPQCTHAEAIAAMQGFDVGLIPFKQTELTDSVDPIKYYEYRALGLPVLSSHFGEMRNHAHQNGVFILHERDDATTVSGTVEAALEYPWNAEEVTSFRDQHSWTSRFNSARLL